MALTITSNGGGGGILYRSSIARIPYNHLLPRRHLTFPTFTTRTSHIVSAKKLSSRTGRFDSKNRRSNTTTKEVQDEDLENSTPGIESSSSSYSSTTESGGIVVNSEGVAMRVLPGEKQDFWEGPQWDGFGFFVQYMWAFGIIFALIACGIAVATYNEGATDFKETPAYKESIQSSSLLEDPEASNSDIFESNPTEVAPSLE